jgi:rubredoxin
LEDNTMAFRIAPLNPMPAELPGAIYEDAQARAEDNHLLQLAQLERLDRAQREESRLGDARLQLQQADLDWRQQQASRAGTRWLDLGDRWELRDEVTGEAVGQPVPRARQAMAPSTRWLDLGDHWELRDESTGALIGAPVPKGGGGPDGGWNTGGGGSRAGGGSSVQRFMPYGGVVGTGGITRPGLPDGGSSYQRDVQTSPPVLTPEASQGFAVGGPVPNMFRGYPSTPQLPVMPGMAGAAFPEGFDPGKWLGTSAAMTPPAAGPRVLDVATAKMYLMRAGGDRARAQALAAADGY